MTRRLVLSYLAITLIVLLLLEIPLAVFFQQREFDRLTADVERDAAVMATIYEDILENDLPPDPVPAGEYDAATGARVVVVDVGGISIVDSEREADRDFSTRPEIATALTGERASGRRRSETLDTDLLFVAVPVASGGTVYGAVRITFDTHEVTERIHRFWTGLAAIAVIILLVMAVVGWLLARSVTRPVRRLQFAAHRFSQGDLTPTVVDTKGPPELAALETGMNDMARRLEDLIERQRSFVADASHQLRTPLTALRLRLENLQSVAPDDTMANDLNNAIDETRRLSALVGDLLQLARAEKRPDPVVVNISDIVRDRVDTWTATAEAEGIRLVNACDRSDQLARALAGGTEQVLDNLIDNAIRAAPPDTEITLDVTTTGSVHRITVADQGRGLSDADKQHALTRFWRSDMSTPGTGLGLAIAKEIVEASGGTLELGDTRPSGLTVTLTLPAVPDASA